MVPIRPTRGFAVLALALGVVVVASPSTAHAELRVVVTSKPIHSLVASVMQGVGSPVLLVDGTASPHNYAMKPSDAGRVNRADILFRVSTSLEPFTARLVRALPRSVKVVALAEAPGLVLLPRRVAGAFRIHAHDEGGHGHSSSSSDPHVWLDPDNAKAMTAAILASLVTRAPVHAAVFNANAARLASRIDALSGDLASTLKDVRGRPFLVFHDAYQYFEKRFGLTAVGAITLSPEQQPSARLITGLRKRVRSLSAVCVFTEPGLQRRIVASVIEDTDARTARLDPEGVALSPGPELYFELMRRLAGAMKTCLVS